MHQRQVIRDKMVSLLIGKTSAGLKVFSNRSLVNLEENLPAICIYTRSENSSEWGHAPRTLKRVVQIAIEIIGAQTTDTSLEDVLDEIAQVVELELCRDDTLVGTVEDCILSGTEFQSDDTGAVPIGSVRLSYDVTYLTDMPGTIFDQPQAQVEDLKEFGVKYNIDKANDDDDPSGDPLIEAEDSVVLQS